MATSMFRWLANIVDLRSRIQFEFGLRQLHATQLDSKLLKKLYNFFFFYVNFRDGIPIVFFLFIHLYCLHIVILHQHKTLS